MNRQEKKIGTILILLGIMLIVLNYSSIPDVPYASYNNIVAYKHEQPIMGIIFCGIGIFIFLYINDTQIINFLIGKKRILQKKFKISKDGNPEKVKDFIYSEHYNNKSLIKRKPKPIKALMVFIGIPLLIVSLMIIYYFKLKNSLSPKSFWESAFMSFTENGLKVLLFVIVIGTVNSFFQKTKK